MPVRKNQVHNQQFKSTKYIFLVPKEKRSKHLPLLKQTAGSVVSSNPEHIAIIKTNFVKHLYITTLIQ